MRGLVHFSEDEALVSGKDLIGSPGPLDFKPGVQVLVLQNVMQLQNLLFSVPARLAAEVVLLQVVGKLVSLDLDQALLVHHQEIRQVVDELCCRGVQGQSNVQQPYVELEIELRLGL